MLLEERLVQALFWSETKIDIDILRGDGEGGTSGFGGELGTKWLYLCRDIDFHGLYANILGIRHRQRGAKVVSDWTCEYDSCLR